jgi:2-dehydropantoate 2-reductase
VVHQRILIVGAGAIGGITAALMQPHVDRVALIGSDRESTDLLREPGLQLERRGELRRVPLEAHRSAATVEGEFAFCLIAVKAPALQVALEPLVARGGIQNFVSLGNGLVQDRIAALVGDERLIAGTVEWGATNIGPGHLRQTSENPFVIGELDGSVRPRTEQLLEALATFSPARITTNITGALWSKLILNSALSGMSVVGGCDCAQVITHPAGRLALRSVWSESYQLGLAQGLELEAILGMEPGALGSPDPAIYGPALEHTLEQSGPTRASMLQDIERGRLSEVDVINGAVVARARQLGATAPFNARVLELVHSFERGELAPSADLFAEVAGAN